MVLRIWRAGAVIGSRGLLSTHAVTEVKLRVSLLSLGWESIRGERCVCCTTHPTHTTPTTIAMAKLVAKSAPEAPQPPIALATSEELSAAVTSFVDDLTGAAEDQPRLSPSRQR